MTHRAFRSEKRVSVVAYTRSARALLVFAVIGACASCVGEQRGVPLYETAGTRPARADVALLLGPVQLVDGEHVGSRGSAFELLPGCHVVEVGGRAGQASEHGGWAGSIPPLVYAMPMRAGATYVISWELDSTFRSGPTERARIVAREHDAEGHERELAIAKDAAAIEACRRATRSQQFPAR